MLFLVTYITSIPAFFVFYAPVLKDSGYITSAGPDSSVLIGAFLELLLIIANVGTALALFPVLKRQNEVLALGYVTARLVESAFIAVGILSLVTVVRLRQEAAGVDATSLTLVAHRRPAAVRVGHRRAVRPAGARGAAQSIATMPEFFWELLLGIYVTVKGFRSSAAACEPARTAMFTERGGSRLPA